MVERIGQAERSRSGVYMWMLPMAIGLLGSGWNHFSGSPGLDGKFLALYIFGVMVGAYLCMETIRGRSLVLPDLTTSSLLFVYLLGASLSALLAGNIIALVGTASHREGLLTFLLYAAAFLVFADRKNGVRASLVGAGLAVAVLINMGLGFTGIETENALSFGRRFVGGFNEPSFLGGFLVLSLPIVGYVAWHSSARIVRVLAIAALVSGHLQLFASGSRAAYLGWITSVVILLVFGVKKTRSPYVRLLYAPASLLLLLPLLLDRFSPASLVTGMGDRLLTWRPIWITGQYVLVGAGPDRLRPATHNRYSLFGAHNGFINDISQIGWVAALAFLALICLMLVRLTRRAWSLEAEQGFFEPWLLAAIAGYTVFMMGNYTRPYVNIIFWALLGLAGKQTSRSPGTSARSKVRWVSAIAGACLMLGSGFVGARSAVASYHYWAHVNVDMSEPVLKAWQPLEKAIRIEPHNEVFREARGDMALKLIDMGFVDIPGVLEPRVAAVEDWEFLIREVYNSRKVYRVLEAAYVRAQVPRDEWLPLPEE